MLSRICTGPTLLRLPSLLASGSWDDTVRLWDVRGSQCLRTFEGHTDAVSAVRLGPDGNQGFSASFDQTVRLWDAKSGGELKVFKGHTSSVLSVVFSPDGTQVAYVWRDAMWRLRHNIIAEFSDLPAQPRLLRRAVHPVSARVSDAIEIPHRDMHPMVVVTPPGLQQKHAMPRLR